MTEEVEVLIPIGPRVLVERGEAKEKTDSGIILPEASKEPPQRGKVHSVGWASTVAEEHSVSPGDEVLLPRYGGTEVILENVEYTLISEEDILGVFKMNLRPKLD